MSQLTEEAKKYCRAVLKEAGRESVVEMLEGIGVACYDDEETELLVDAAVDSVEAGDIEIDWSYAYANSLGVHIYALWLDFDEIWEGTC